MKSDPSLKLLLEAIIIVKLHYGKTNIYKHGACARLWFLKEIELNYNVLFTLTFFSGRGSHFYAAVLRGCSVNVKETQVCKHMANTHQLARIAAFPCGDGELQQVNVQNTHIVCDKKTQGGFYWTATLFESDSCLHH